MDESTFELIPISLIESIIYDSDIFIKFIRTPNDKIFLNQNAKDLAIALTQYMDYAIKNSNNLSKDLFDRINYISSYFKLDKNYDFEKYMESTTKIISFQEIEQILSKEDIFNKFIDFENNKDFFKEDISVYLNNMSEMFNYYENSSIEIPSIQIDRYRKIMEKYSLKLKKYHKLEGYESSNNVNENLFTEILKNVDLNGDKFTLAYSLYVELCKVVITDINFSALNQNINDQIAYDIYNKNINQIDVKNNEVVCKTWAEIYQKLLENVGISAKVTGNFHKYVLFDCDGTLIKADATQVYYDKETTIKMNDLTRVKLDYDTVGFTCVEKEKNIDLPLQEAREKINLRTKSFPDEIKKIEQNYCSTKINNDEEIEKKLTHLFSLVTNSNVFGIELLCYMLALTKVFFKNDKNKVKAIPVYKKIENGYDANMLYIIKNDTCERYIIFDKNKPNLEYSKEQIINMLDNDILKMKNIHYKEVENEYTNSSRKK